uniref:F-box domain-containing protein n=1 Tax=Poecilia mexicana TaxID=48701 RepID=A0A3B3WMZ8_9TELE
MGRGKILWRLPKREHVKESSHNKPVMWVCSTKAQNEQLLMLRTLNSKEQHGFIDLEMLPPELGITILSYLNATDLCLAGCVWQDLGHDEYLWQGLCKSTWGHCSIYNKRLPAGFSYRRLYLQLDEGSLTFNANPQEVTTSCLKEY